MDNYGESGSNSTRRPLRKRRSTLSRRPFNESEYPQEYRDSISLSSTPSDHVSDAPSMGKESSTPSLNLADAETVHMSNEEGYTLEESTDLKSSLEDNPAATRWKSRQMKDIKISEQATADHHSELLGTASDGTGTGNKVNKVKLKVGGVTHTIHTKSSSSDSSIAGIFAAKSSSDAIYPLPKLNPQERFNLRHRNEKGNLHGVPWKDFSKTGLRFGKVDSAGTDIPEEPVRQTLKSDRSSKNKSIIKKKSANEVYDDYDDDDDDEIRYLQKLKTSRIASYDNTEYEDGTIRGKKLRKISRVIDRDIKGSSLSIGDYGSVRSVKESTKSRYSRASEDTDYSEEESVSDGEVEHENMKQRKAPIEYSKESSITTRRRATLTGREDSPGLGAKSIQFPDGLPPAPPRKTKEQLSEVEQQLKRAEAAQRRRIQTEKAARESEAEAIRKILGQDSSRKRREEKNKKRQEELAQERNANAATIQPDAVRWVMGPSGTIVTFPNEIGLPSIFESKSCSYPPPRETCAAPSCTNLYKYRDSKSKLPLCSLQCYKALHAC